MNTQTIERQEIFHRIDSLPDSAMPTLVEFLDFLRYKEDWKKHTPNAETIAAMEELQSGAVETISFEEFKAQIDALD